MPSSMCARLVACHLLAVTALLVPRTARAQAGSDVPMAAMDGPRFSGGGEITFVTAPSDDGAFFDYTDYSTNALRTARVRLFGEWRVTDGLSAMGEFRAQDASPPSARALYLRWRPMRRIGLSIQAGRIPPVIGAYSRRAYGRDNAVIGQPLVYQYLTSLRPDAVPATVDDLLRMRGRGWQPSYPVGARTDVAGVPLVSASRWDTGVEASWQRPVFEIAAALTRGSPAVPVVRESNQALMWSGRGAVHIRALTVGVSGARGQWLSDAVLDLTPLGRKTPANQTFIGTDFEFGLGAWLIRSEWMRTVFELPIVDRTPAAAALHATGGFVEGRYRLRPRWDVGARFDAVGFDAITADSPSAVPVSWDAPVTRVEATLGLRVTRRFGLRGGWQENWRPAGRVTQRGYPTAMATYWF